MRKIAIVIPVLNEERNIERIAAEIRKNTVSVSEAIQLVFVDDGSTDRTWRTIESLHEKSKDVTGFRLSRNFGKEAAILCGMKEVDAQAYIFIDGDLQHPPSVIAELISQWRNGRYDVVEARKRTRGRESVASKLQSKLFYFIFKRLCGYDLDNASDFKLVDRRVADSLVRLPEAGRFFRALVEWVGYEKCTVYFDVNERREDKSKWGTIKLIKYSLANVASFTSIPLQFSGLISVVFGLFSIVLGLQTLYNKFSGNSVSGFTTVILLLLIVGASVLFVLSIIGYYLGKIYAEVKQRPIYLLRNKIKIDD